MLVRYRKRKATRVLPFNPWDHDIEVGDLLIMSGGDVVRAVESRGNDKSRTGELTYEVPRPPKRLRGARAIAIDGVVWWYSPHDLLKERRR